MKKSLKIAISILAVSIFVIVLVGAFTFLRPQDPEKLFNESKDKAKNETPFEDRPGITNVRKFSDAKDRVSQSKNVSGNISKNASVRPTRTPKPLPYPRIEINFTSRSVDTIGNNSAGEKNKFLIVELDIRNYGYKYFDAYPTRFKIIRGGRIIDPIVNVSTGNTIDAVIPNNSRSKGDIIFLLKSREASIRSLKYMPDTYKILYNRVSSIEDKDTENDEEYE